MDNSSRMAGRDETSKLRGNEVVTLLVGVPAREKVPLQTLAEAGEDLVLHLGGHDRSESN
jgi:hypothetical protein